jgi:hypothetical protein
MKVLCSAFEKVWENKDALGKKGRAHPFKVIVVFLLV